MSMEAAQKKTPAQIVRLDNAFKMAGQWVNNMSKAVEDEPAEVESEGRPSRLGLGAKEVSRHSKARLSNDPVERRLYAKLEAGKRRAAKLIEDSIVPARDCNEDDDSDGELESRTSTFAPSNPLQIAEPSLFLQLSHLFTLSMATKTDNPSTAAVEDNPSETLDTAVPDSTKPDRGEDSTNTASSTVELATEGPKKDSENSKNAAPVTDIEKKIRRAERFGITVQLSEQEKRNSRAERFGTSTGTGSTAQGSESDSVKKSEELKRKARAERFGIPVPPAASDEEAKKKSRVERFTPAAKSNTLEEDKRKARALRFSQSSSGSLSINGKGDIEPKAAIAGEAGGGS